VASDNDLTSWPAKLWTADLCGDGTGQLLFELAGAIHVLRDPSVASVARWPASGTIRDIWPGGAGRAATIVVNDTASRITGLSGATGQPAWRCDGAGALKAVLPDANDKPPLVVYQHDGVTICRRALPVDKDGRYVLPVPSAADYPESPDDPTAVRQLPWAESGGPPHGAFFLVLPVALFYLWFVRRRRWPVLALLVGVPLVSALLGAAWLLVDGGMPAPGQRYDWSEWYTPLAIAWVFTGMVTVLACVVLAGLRFVKTFGRDKRAGRPTPAGTSPAPRNHSEPRP
jgi:hypothetical protein